MANTLYLKQKTVRQSVKYCQRHYYNYIYEIVLYKPDEEQNMYRIRKLYCMGGLVLDTVTTK